MDWWSCKFFFNFASSPGKIKEFLNSVLILPLILIQIALSPRMYVAAGAGVGVVGGDRDERAEERDGPAERAATGRQPGRLQSAEGRGRKGRLDGRVAARSSARLTMAGTTATATAGSWEKRGRRWWRRRWSSILESRWRSTGRLSLSHHFSFRSLVKFLGNEDNIVNKKCAIFVSKPHAISLLDHSSFLKVKAPQNGRKEALLAA